MMRVMGLLGLLLSINLSKAENYTLALLRTGYGTRVAGMGGAFVGVSDDATAGWWNPAGLSQISRPEGIFGYRRWITGFHNQFGCFSYYSFGTGLLLSESQIESYDASNRLKGKYIASSTIGFFSYAYKFRKRMGVGASVKFLYENLGPCVGTGVVLDIGLLSSFSPFWRVGISVRDFGPGIYYSEGGWFRPPISLRIGGSFSLSDVFVIASDIDISENRRAYLSVGGEYKVDVVKLRLGYHTGPQSIETLGVMSGFSSGLGVEYRNIKIDYAFLPYGELGMTHWISIGFRF